MHYVIHIGPPKTATTAVQGWFKVNRTNMAEQGIFWTETGTRDWGNAQDLVSAIPDMGNPLGIKRNAGILARYRSEVKGFGGDTVILSSEYFFDRLTGALPRLSSIIHEQVDNKVRALREFCDSVGATRRTIVIVLRNAADRWVSKIGQSLKAIKAPRQKMEQARKNIYDAIEPYDILCDSFEAAGFDICLVLYADPASHVPLMVRIMNATGLGDRIQDNWNMPERLNTSMGIIGCYAALIVNISIHQIHQPKNPQAKTARKMFSKALQEIYYRSKIEDRPFNNVGPELARKITTAEDTIVYANMTGLLNAEERALLKRSKWLTEPISPLVPEELDSWQRTKVQDLLLDLLRHIEESIDEKSRRRDCQKILDEIAHRTEMFGAQSRI